MTCSQNLRHCKAKCCTFFELIVTGNKDTERYFNLHGLKTARVDKKSFIIRFDIPCKKLDKTSKKCTIYNKRPELCKLYPRQNDPIPKKCIYKRV